MVGAAKLPWNVCAATQLGPHVGDQIPLGGVVDPSVSQEGREKSVTFFSVSHILGHGNFSQYLFALSTAL
jgi:hypothetical protein